MTGEVRRTEYRERRSRSSRAARAVADAKAEADLLDERLAATWSGRRLRLWRLRRARDAARRREREFLKRLTWKGKQRQA